MKKIFLIIALGFLAIFSTTAQETLKGKVTDVNGKTVVGALVMLKGKTIGTVTDVNGDYEIKVKKGDVLVFDALGAASVEKTFEGKSPLNVKFGKAVSTAKITLFDRYGEKIYENSGVALPRSKLAFSDFMDDNRYEKLAEGKYFYLIDDNGKQKAGFISKYGAEDSLKILIKSDKLVVSSEEDGTFIGKSKGGNTIKIKGKIKNSSKAIYLNGKKLDGEEKLDTVINNASIEMITMESEDNDKTKVLMIKTDKKSKKSGNIVICSTSTPLSKKPLIVIGGILQPKNNTMKELSPDSIEDISVLRGNAATAIYGTRGANGVILVTTKNKKPVFNFGSSSATAPVYYIDGKKATQSDLNAINSGDFESVQLIKSKEDAEKKGIPFEEKVIIYMKTKKKK